MIAGLAEEKGDARFALELLWRSAKISDQEGKEKLISGIRLVKDLREVLE